MEKLLIPRQIARKLDCVFEHDTPNGGRCYSLHLKKEQDTIWCDSIEEVYDVLAKLW